MEDNWFGALALEKEKFQSHLPSYQEVSDSVADTASTVEGGHERGRSCYTRKDGLWYYKERHASREGTYSTVRWRGCARARPHSLGN